MKNIIEIASPAPPRAEAEAPAGPMICQETIGDLTFDASFDSGNAARVEPVGEEGNEFALWTLRDCEGTPGENGCRTWFAFSVRGAAPGRTLAFRIHNMNSQGNLYRHDMRPVYRSLPSKPGWERMTEPAKFWGGKSGDKYREMRENRAYDATAAAGDEFVLRFEHLVETPADETLYFAFCFPYAVTDCAARLAWLDALYQRPTAPVWPPDATALGSHKQQQPVGNLSNKDSSAAATPEAAALSAALAASATSADAAAAIAAAAAGAGDASTSSLAEARLAAAAVALAAGVAPLVADGSIYYHRELLTRSLDGRRLDLITISSTSGKSSTRDAELSEVRDAGLPTAASEGGLRAHAFPGKPVFLLTARVHPGETPASHVLDGALKFLLDPADPRAIALRSQFVFKLIPMINPDGVYRGHYRSDTLGFNLNRVYLAPSAQQHPTVFAITRLVAELHACGSLQFYIDCHAHSNKRGCFLFGNAMPDAEAMGQNVTYAKCVEANSRWVRAHTKAPARTQRPPRAHTRNALPAPSL